MTDMSTTDTQALPEPIAHRYWSVGHRSRWQLAGKHAPPDAEPLYSKAQMLAALASAQPACTWTHADDDSGTWATTCGNLFSFTEDGPKENDFKHCCYCGGKLALPLAGDGEGGK